MEILLTDEEVYSFMHTALCTMGYGSFYPVVSKEAKQAARESLAKSQPEGTMICREDIWIQSLKNDGYMTFEDTEEGGHKRVGFIEMKENLKKLPIRNLANFIDETGDVEDDDIFLQIAILGEVVYG